MTYNNSVKNIFIQLKHEGKSFKTISENLKINVQTLYKWNSKYIYNITNMIPLDEYLNDMCFIHHNNKKYYYNEIIKEFVDDNEGCTLPEIHKAINKEISYSSICRLLKELNISRKSIKTHIVGMDIDRLEELRRQFADNTSTHDMLNYKSIDECYFNVNMYRTKGYSKKNKKIEKTFKHKQTKQSASLLLMISNTGYIEDYNIYERSINAQMYLDFIEHNKDVLENQTLFQDNARTHHAKIVKAYTEQNNITMKYNSPYSPKFNPIELLFSEIKKIFKDLEHDNLCDAIEKAISRVNLQNINSYYTHAINEVNKYKSV